jgi:hypothetical protein
MLSKIWWGASRLRAEWPLAWRPTEPVEPYAVLTLAYNGGPAPHDAPAAAGAVMRRCAGATVSICWRADLCTDL